MQFAPALPIDAVLPELVAALADRQAAILVAPPGAGKTTRVPLVLAAQPWAADRKLIMLEPRRLAARAAAARLAATLGEELGATVGLRVRMGAQVSARTRIEVVTPGVFTRMILDDPSLEHVAAVLFDEFHERSLDADLGLALALDVQSGLREDLRVVAMSATLEAARLRTLMADPPLISSQGQAFPVETRYVGRDPRLPIEPQVADAIMAAMASEPGSVLAFLPGVAEIRRVQTILAERRLDPRITVVGLSAALDLPAQNRAIAPAPAGQRKIVLATAIAETSLTIEGIRIVVDSGLARVPRFEPETGLTRLETVRVSRAGADQRRGRAGRMQPGLCVRLWDAPQTAALEPHARPEILAADLSALVLDLAFWGVTDPARLKFLDPPPAGALSQARRLLEELSAIDADGRITVTGRRLRALPLPPRLARMLIEAAADHQQALAADIAAILTERGLGGDDVDLHHRLDAFRADRSRWAQDARRMAQRWAAAAADRSRPPTPPTPPTLPTPLAPASPGAVLAIAFADRIAKNRGGSSGFVLANGRGAHLDQALALAREPYLVVADLSGPAGGSRILLAAAISLAEIEGRFAGQIAEDEAIEFDSFRGGLRARRRRRLGALVLSEQPIRLVPTEASAQLLARGLMELGLDRLPFGEALAQWRHRVAFMRRIDGPDWPDLSAAALHAAAPCWLARALAGKTALDELTEGELTAALKGLLAPDLKPRLESGAPPHLALPSGGRAPIDYAPDAGPTVSVVVQELYGLDRHPTVAQGRVRLRLALLSPARRPIQVTADLPGFWRGSYQEVKTQMKGRYPKHAWPDNPLDAAPTRGPKARRRP
jgi:ATP-dependent helicase HrpB